jgi:hypothetical protein
VDSGGKFVGKDFPGHHSVHLGDRRFKVEIQTKAGKPVFAGIVVRAPSRKPPFGPCLAGRRGCAGRPHPVSTLMPVSATSPGGRLRGVATPAPAP